MSALQTKWRMKVRHLLGKAGDPRAALDGTSSSNTCQTPQPHGQEISRSIPLTHRTPIRLLRIYKVSDDEIIRCSLEAVKLSSRPQYKALSYRWGAPTKQAEDNGMTNEKSCSIICNHKEFLVTENLFDFLCRAAQQSQCTLWW